eukprot:superscaffoldBa00000407_g4484
MDAYISLCVQIVVMFLCGTVFSTDISCKNEAGEPVDWFIIYKLPRYKIGEVGSGVDYMYLDSSVGSWQMSKFMVNDSEGAIANTLNQLYMGEAYKSNSSVYALYNDAPPILDYLRGYGHTKDIYTGWVAQALDTDLLVETWQTQNHELPSNCSLPRHTMNIKRIQLPGSVKFLSHHDHSKWCVSRVYEDQVTCLGDLNREKAQMWRGGGLVCSFNPLIYKAFRQAVDLYILYKLPPMNDDGLSYAYMDESTNGWVFSRETINSTSGTLANTLKPLLDFYDRKTEGFGFMLYNDQPANSKSAAPSSFGHSKDLYSGLIVNYLEQDLYVKSWGKMRRPLPSNCSTSIPHSVYNVTEVKVPGRKPFSDTVDHSKWCVTSGGGWACIADMNREESQMDRGEK